MLHHAMPSLPGRLSVPAACTHAPLHVQSPAARADSKVLPAPSR